MNIVHSGDTYQIYGNTLQTYKELPVGTYEIGFHKMMGFFLKDHADLNVKEEKIYGSTPEKVEKVLKGFQKVNRNFGVILSGKKGIGKSLFARQLATRAKEYNLPLIIVPNYVPGIADFISSIEQEVIVLFDEFEKTFASSDDFNPQEELLSLFDGLDGGKKLFIITCNEVHRLNSYFINRPGRFHYHFILGNPSPEEIREYMEDKLDVKYHSCIKKLLSFAINVDLTYDILRAIVFEINCGYSLEETLMDLNISKEGVPRYNIKVEFADGSVRVREKAQINTCSNDKNHCWFSGKIGNHDSAIRIDFTPTDIIVDLDHSEMTIDPSLVDKYISEDEFDLDNEKDREIYEYLKNLEIKKISFHKVTDDFASKYLI